MPPRGSSECSVDSAANLFGWHALQHEDDTLRSPSHGCLVARSVFVGCPELGLVPAFRALRSRKSVVFRACQRRHPYLGRHGNRGRPHKQMHNKGHREERYPLRDRHFLRGAGRWFGQSRRQTLRRERRNYAVQRGTFQHRPRERGEDFLPLVQRHPTAVDASGTLVTGMGG